MELSDEIHNVMSRMKRKNANGKKTVETEGFASQVANYLKELQMKSGDELNKGRWHEA